MSAVSVAAKRVVHDLLLQTSWEGAIAVLVDAGEIPEEDIARALRECPAGPPFLELLRIISGPVDPRVSSVVYGKIGASYRQRDRPDLAEKFYERALEQANGAQERALAVVSLARLALARADDANAERRLQVVQALAEQ